MTIYGQFVKALETDPKDSTLRSVFADWCEENGKLELASELRKDQQIALSPVKEVTVAELHTGNAYGDNWLYVFGEDGCSSNESNKTDPCPPGSDVDCTAPTRKDVVDVIAAVNGENDGPAWTGVFKLCDGRYLLADGSCDYTGWG